MISAAGNEHESKLNRRRPRRPCSALLRPPHIGRCIGISSGGIPSIGDKFDDRSHADERRFSLISVMNGDSRSRNGDVMNAEENKWRR